MKNLILSMGIMFVAVSSGMYTNIAQAEYPQSTTTPLAVDLDFNGKNIANAGIGTFNGVRIPAGDLIMTGSAEAIYTNATNSDLTIRSNGTGKLSLNPSSSGVVEIGNDVYIKGPRPWIDVRAYGAKGDGVTDDRAAIQAAWDALPTTGGTVKIPVGTYLLGGSLNLGIKRGQLIGAGFGATTLRLANGANSDAILVGDGITVPTPGDGKSPSLIAYLTIDGNSWNQTMGSGIRVRSGADLTISGVYVYDCKENGIYISGTAPATPGALTIHNSRVEYCKQHGIFVKANYDGVRILSSLINDNGTTGSDYYNIYAENDGTVIIKGNIIWQGKRANIRLHGVQHFVISGNKILSSPRENILLTGGARGTGNGTITANAIHSASESAPGTYPHIQLGQGTGNTASDISIVGNSFTNPAGYETSAAVNEAAGSNNNLVGLNVVTGSSSAINLVGSGSRKVQNNPEDTSLLGSATMNGILNIYNASAPNSARLGTRVTGDAVDRFLLLADGEMRWGGGVGGSDVFLTRPAPAILQLSGQFNSNSLQIGGGAVVSGHLSNTVTWDPPSLTDNSVASTTVTVTGAAIGNIVYASHNQIGANNIQISAHVQAADTVRVVLRNVTGGALDIPSGTLRVNVWKY